MTPATTCPTCGAGGPCVLHDPLFVELIDLPGVPAGPALPVHRTPAELPLWRRKARRPRSAREEELLRDVEALSRRTGLELA